MYNIKKNKNKKIKININYSIFIHIKQLKLSHKKFLYKRINSFLSEFGTILENDMYFLPRTYRKIASKIKYLRLNKEVSFIFLYNQNFFKKDSKNVTKKVFKKVSKKLYKKILKK